MNPTRTQTVPLCGGERFFATGRPDRYCPRWIEAYREADTVLRKALAGDPENRSLLLARAKVTNQLKDYKETIRLSE